MSRRVLGKIAENVTRITNYLLWSDKRATGEARGTIIICINIHTDACASKLAQLRQSFQQICSRRTGGGQKCKRISWQPNVAEMAPMAEQSFDIMQLLCCAVLSLAAAAAGGNELCCARETDLKSRVHTIQ